MGLSSWLYLQLHFAAERPDGSAASLGADGNIQGSGRGLHRSQLATRELRASMQRTAADTECPPRYGLSYLKTQGKARPAL